MFEVPVIARYPDWSVALKRTVAYRRSTQELPGLAVQPVVSAIRTEGCEGPLAGSIGRETDPPNSPAVPKSADGPRLAEW